MCIHSKQRWIERWWAPISHTSWSMPSFSSLLLNVGGACDLLPPIECSSSDVPNPGLGHSLADSAFALLGALSPCQKPSSAVPEAPWRERGPATTWRLMLSLTSWAPCQPTSWMQQHEWPPQNQQKRHLAEQSPWANKRAVINHYVLG